MIGLIIGSLGALMMFMGAAGLHVAIRRLREWRTAHPTPRSSPEDSNSISSSFRRIGRPVFLAAY